MGFRHGIKAFRSGEMGFAKVEIDRFNGIGDFALWHQKMRAILVQMKVANVLDAMKPLSATMLEDEKIDISELEYNTIILHLSDKGLQEVSKETNADGVRKKLKTLYMTKPLTNQIYLKGLMFGFRMNEDKHVDESLDDFSKIVMDLENIGVKVEEEDQAIIILKSLPRNYAYSC